MVLLVALPVAAAPKTSPLTSSRQQLQALQSEQQAAETQAARLVEQAEQLAHDADVTTAHMVDIAAEIQQREDKLSGLEERLKELETERRQRLQQMLVRRTEVLRLVGALQNLSRRPSQLVLVRPGAAIDTARTAMLLTKVLPSLRAKADALKRDIAEMESLRTQLQGQRVAYQTEVAKMQHDRVALDALRAERQKARATALQEAEAKRQKALALAAQARDVRDLLARLEVEERKRRRLASLPGPRLKPDFTPRIAQAPTPAPPHAVNPGPGPAPRPAPAPPPPTVAIARPPQPLNGGPNNPAFPVRGEVVQPFGATTANGTAKGITLKTRPNAQVVAPYAGRVVFSGPFRAYGQLLIIAHGEGYHSLIAGMSRIDAHVGQILRTGEPIGVMGSAEDGASAASLYVEIRRGGEPINPLVWLQSVGKRSS